VVGEGVGLGVGGVIIVLIIIILKVQQILIKLATQHIARLCEGNFEEN
jgi:hypothetical protein